MVAALQKHLDHRFDQMAELARLRHEEIAAHLAGISRFAKAVYQIVLRAERREQEKAVVAVPKKRRKRSEPVSEQHRATYDGVPSLAEIEPPAAAE